MTESDELTDALNDAAGRYPGLSRSQLLVQLAIAGSRAARDAQEARRGRRLTALRGHAGVLTGLYTGSLDELRADWPA